MFVPGVGDSRFGPLPGLHHVYMAASATAALLESALHEASPPAPRIYRAQLRDRVLSEVRQLRELRLIDLRDEILDRLGLRREQVVATSPAHYPCTRALAAALRVQRIAGEPVDGLLWHSRQTDAYRAAGRSAILGDLLRAHPVELVVVWQPAGTPSPLEVIGEPRPLDSGNGLRLVTELANLIGAPIL